MSSSDEIERYKRWAKVRDAMNPLWLLLSLVVLGVAITHRSWQEGTIACMMFFIWFNRLIESRSERR